MLRENRVTTRAHQQMVLSQDMRHFVTSKQILPIISNNRVIPVTLSYTLFLQLLLSIHYLWDELSVKRQAICLSECITMESAEI